MMRRVLFSALLACSHLHAAEPLPALDADKQYTVSGVSSGAYMAVQFHVAYSAVVKGAGALAGGPYYCAQGSAWTAYYNCMTPGWLSPLPSIAALAAETDRLAKAGRIDAPANLASSRAWLFTGTQDGTVARDVVEGLHAFYTRYSASTVVVGDKPAGHAMVTENAGNACAVTAAPFINDCDYDAAGELLKHLLGALAAPAANASGRLLRFDQQPFGSYGVSMDDEGYVFIPKACESERCRVHVAFHGCRQGADDVGERFVREAGYNRWAEANRLIVLYPQAIRRYWAVYNPRGCWDWWGYSGASYASRDGLQLKAVRRMLAALGA